MMASRPKDLNVIPASTPGPSTSGSLSLEIIPHVTFVWACFPSSVEMVRMLPAVCGHANHWQHHLAGI